MTTITILGSARSRQFGRSISVTTAVPEPRRTGRAVARIGAGVAIVVAAAGFAAVSLGEPPLPAGDVVVAPVLAHPTVPGRSTLPVLHLATAFGSPA